MGVPITLRIRPTRSVLDVYRRLRFVVEDRFPGGRTILRGKGKTHAEARSIAVAASQPQTSQNAGSGQGGYQPPGTGPRIPREINLE